MALTMEALQFELERSFKLFKPTTTMPDKTQLAYDSDPNNVRSTRSPGELLLAKAPIGTGYIQSDGSYWQKVEDTEGGLWTLKTAGSGGGTVKENPYNDWVDSNRVSETSLHLEEYSILIAEGGLPIYFNSARAEDEGGFAHADETQFFLESMQPLLIEGGEALYMASHDGAPCLPRYLMHDLENWRDIGRGRFERLQEADKHVYLVRPDTTEVYLDRTDAWVYVHEDSSTHFRIENQSVQRWGTSPAYVLFPNHFIIEVDISAGTLQFRKIGANTWRVTNLNMGETYDYDITE